MKQQFSRLFKLLGLLLLSTAFILAFLFYYKAHQPLLKSDSSVTYVFAPGLSSRALAQDLAKKQVVDSPLFFEALTRLSGVSRKLKAGEYQINPGDTAVNLLKKMVAGDVVKHFLTIVEGWTFKEMLVAIENDPDIIPTLKQLPPEAIMPAIGLGDVPPEGLFFPDTYRFPRGITDKEFLLRAHRKMQETLSDLWGRRDIGLPYESDYEVIIAASLIEKETHLSDEREKISGIIVRRLRTKMRLQIDPTIIYALGDRYTGKLSKKDLKLRSPYNTYLHKGLPPTPIALPGLASLDAAIHPDVGKSLYFVAKEDGSHFFSNSLAEHNRAVRKYRLKKLSAHEES